MDNAPPLAAGFFTRFSPDGTATMGASSQRHKGDRAGYFILPRIVPLDSKIGTTTIDTSNTDLNWDVVSGTWATLIPLKPGGGTAIYNVGSASVHRASTRGTIPANRGLAFDLSFLHQNTSGGAPYFRITIGSKWSLYFSHDSPLEVHRATLVQQGSVQTIGWQVVKALSGTPSIDVGGGRYTVQFFRVDGRLVVRIAGHTFWFWEPSPTQNQTNPAGNTGQATQLRNTAAQVQEASWPEGKVSVECGNTRVRIEVAVIKWAQANGTPLQGQLQRTVNHAEALDPDATLSGSCAGWKRSGTGATITSALGASIVTYTLALQGNADGIDSPFVDKAVAVVNPVWKTWTPDPLDLRPACESLTISHALPPAMVGSQATLVFDREELERFFPSWQDYLAPWNPIEIRIKRTGGGFTKSFKGYITQPTPSSDSARNRKISIVARDQTARLSKIGDANLAPIDHRYAPLDFLYAQKYLGVSGGYNTSGSPVPSGRLYAAECVQYIIRQELGDDVANSMNGDGNPLRFLSNGHLPILDASNDTVGWVALAGLLSSQPVVAEGKFLLPPPFGDAAYDWIMQLAKQDHCVFFFAYLPGYSTDWPVPVYGRLITILADAALGFHTLKSVAVGGDWARLMESVETTRKPERDINRVLAWGTDSDSLGGLIPSINQGIANLPPSDPRSAFRTFPRTLIVREPISLVGADALARGILSQLSNIDLQWPTFNIEGDEQINVGDVVTAQIDGDYPDTTLGLGGRLFRAEQIDHALNFKVSPGAFKTTIYPRPLATQEELAFRQGHGLV